MNEFLKYIIAVALNCRDTLLCDAAIRYAVIQRWIMLCCEDALRCIKNCLMKKTLAKVTVSRFFSIN